MVEQLNLMHRIAHDASAILYASFGQIAEPLSPYGLGGFVDHVACTVYPFLLSVGIVFCLHLLHRQGMLRNDAV